MNYYTSLSIISEYLPSDCFLITEGSGTMDVSRTLLSSEYPKRRLDAGTFGTMGIGLPFAIAAKAIYPELTVVLVMGDSAFGFSGFELETAVRNGVNFKIIVINNNGIFLGISELP